jgi:Leucine-rich repeat (LRR) protein
MGNLRQIKNVYLNDNKLVGTIPSVLVNSSELYFLTLNNNDLVGTIPSIFGNLHQLQYFDVSGNQLVGVPFQQPWDV